MTTGFKAVRRLQKDNSWVCLTSRGRVAKDLVEHFTLPLVFEKAKDAGKCSKQM